MSDDAELKKAGLKVTLPRLRILELLEHDDKGHLSAEEIYRRLIEAGEEVGLATVYRVLTQFEQAGICIIEERQKKLAKKEGYEIVDHSMVLYVKPLKK